MIYTLAVVLPSWVTDVAGLTAPGLTVAVIFFGKKKENTIGQTRGGQTGYGKSVRPGAVRPSWL